MKKKYTLVLGSRSPRRHQLLSYLNVPFDIMNANLEEKTERTIPHDVACDLARQKGDVVMKRLARREDFGKTFFPLVISADTIVVLNDDILGKPDDDAHAREMLMKLSGKTHCVITGVYLSLHDIETGVFRDRVFYSKSDVRFAPVSKDLLDNYIATGESLDKAGAYGIQGESLTFISDIQGSYSNVVGLPLAELVIELKAILGYEKDEEGLWRCVF